jgi:hypothetical protein
VAGTMVGITSASAATAAPNTRHIQ